MNISAEKFKKKLLNNEHLPSGLVVHGDLDLYGCTSLTNLPERLVVDGYLDLEGCISLTHLPSGLVVHGYLDLCRCTSLTRLPKRLVVHGWLCLNECTSLTNLPEGLVINGIIYCNEELINKIPKEDLPLYINFSFGPYIKNLIMRRLYNASRPRFTNTHK